MRSVLTVAGRARMQQSIRLLALGWMALGFSWPVQDLALAQPAPAPGDASDVQGNQRSRDVTSALPATRKGY